MPWRYYPACRADEIAPGAKRRLEIEGYDLCLYNVGGKYYASGDPCPHEHASLGDGGMMDGEQVVCGAHRWCFNVRTGECSEDSTGRYRLRTFPVGRKEGVIYVGFWTDREDTLTPATGRR
jgi:nitrite reductase/ring-hydroxylating ferredoxin subunit